LAKSFTELAALSNQLFKFQYPMLTLYQTLADHFYPERADFTTTRNVGQEFADNLVDSYPVIVRRDLGNAFNAMLRDGHWFKISTQEASHDREGTAWLEWATQVQRKSMYQRSAGFNRAVKQGDHDFATFGQCVISIEMNRKRNGLLYRNWHLRDVAWREDETGEVGDITRRWKPTNIDLKTIFGNKVHPKVIEACIKEPYSEVDVRHIVLSSEVYGDESMKQHPYVSIYIDMVNEHVIEVQPLTNKYYVVPRFQTIAGQPYAYSPATVAGLPDARCLQAMTHTLLEAGERYARPPIIATSQAVRGDVDLAPNGITWVDKDYDEKLGAALRPMYQSQGGFPIGLELRSEIKNILSSAFYLNKITLPQGDHEMTATETIERMKQYRREALPLFMPVESEYNGQVCEITFDLMMKNNLFGSPHDVPQSLRGAEVEYQFESPLTSSAEEKKVNQFHQTAQLLAETVQFDPTATANVNLDEALRTAVKGTGAPEFWLNDPKQVAQQRAQQQAQAAQEQVQ
jgi:hypothetical protein